jgi:uncharacterized repeat protein (TIGR03803 family)
MMTKFHFFRNAAIFFTALTMAVPLSAQSFNNFYNFTAGTNGSSPNGGLILSGKTFYGTTVGGGANGSGSVFSVNTNGLDYTTLYSFPAGKSPNGGLILSDRNLFGFETEGVGFGSIYSISTSGSGYTLIYSSPADHSVANGPNAGFIISGKTLYATTLLGGTNGDGSIFAINIDGSGFKNLYSFAGVTDGTHPNGGLILVGKTLYGTAARGGIKGVGSIFAINTDGSGFRNLYSFTGDSDGTSPNGGLVLVGKTLYGTAGGGGINNCGSIFAINTDGSGFRNLYSFAGDSDGTSPNGGLTLVGKTLYGTAIQGGVNLVGSVFSVNTDGTGFNNFYSFASDIDGSSPNGGLILLGNTLYGTTGSGGINGVGNIYSLSLPKNYKISLTALPLAGGSVQGEGSFDENSSVTITATANNGYRFNDWLEKDKIISTNSSYNFTVGANRSLEANFRRIIYSIGLSSSPSSGGTVSGKGNFFAETSHTAKATPKSGFAFVNWTDAGNVVSTASSYTFPLSSNKTLVANFSPEFALKLIAKPVTGGVVSGSGLFVSGSSSTVKAIAKKGYVFANWTEGTNVVTSMSTYGFALSTNTTLTANFIKN